MGATDVLNGAHVLALALVVGLALWELIHRDELEG